MATQVADDTQEPASDQMRGGKQHPKIEAPVSPTEKTCRTCNTTKPLEQFATIGGRRRRDCRACQSVDLIPRSKSRTAAAVEAEQRSAAKPERRRKNALAVFEWTVAHPDAHRARSLVQRALKKGSLVRPTVCAAQGCTASKLEAHHADYRHPLDVLWLCQKHHRRLHEQVDFNLVGGVSWDAAGFSIPPELKR